MGAYYPEIYRNAVQDVVDHTLPTRDQIAGIAEVVKGYFDIEVEPHVRKYGPQIASHVTIHIALQYYTHNRSTKAHEYIGRYANGLTAARSAADANLSIESLLESNDIFIKKMEAVLTLLGKKRIEFLPQQKIWKTDQETFAWLIPAVAREFSTNVAKDLLSGLRGTPRDVAACLAAVFTHFSPSYLAREIGFMHAGSMHERIDSFCEKMKTDDDLRKKIAHTLFDFFDHLGLATKGLDLMHMISDKDSLPSALQKMRLRIRHDRELHGRPKYIAEQLVMDLGYAKDDLIHPEARFDQYQFARDNLGDLIAQLKTKGILNIDDLADRLRSSYGYTAVDIRNFFCGNGDEPVWQKGRHALRMLPHLIAKEAGYADPVRPYAHLQPASLEKVEVR